MTLVLDESEDISWQLLSPLLASVMKENQVSSTAKLPLLYVFHYFSETINSIHSSL